MERNTGFLLCVIIICVIMLFIAIVKKAEWLLNFVMRGILGTIGIYLTNTALLAYYPDLLIEINPCTVLTSATLGFPGLLLLYGIRICNFL